MEQFGVAINEADVKARAYQLGIAKVGTELTHAQTAQAAWSLILDKTKQQQGEAARTIDDDANALKRLHQATDEVAESFGAVILPAAAKATNGITEFLKTLNDMPTGAKVVVTAVGGIAAAIAPAIITVGLMTRGLTDFRAAMVRLSATEGIAGTVSAGMGKLALTLGPIALLATAGALAIYDLEKAFDDEAAAADEASKNTAQYVEYLKALGRAHAHAPTRTATTTAAGSDGGITAPTFDDAMKSAADRTKVILDSVQQVDGKFATITGLGDAWVNQLALVNRLLAEAEQKFGRISRQYVDLNAERRELLGAVAITPPSGSIDMAGLDRLMNPPKNTLVGNVVQGNLPSFESFNIIPNKLDQTNQALQAGFNSVAQSIGYTLADNLGNKLQLFLASRGVGQGAGGQIGGGIGSAFGGGAGRYLGGQAAAEVGGVIGAGLGSIIPVAGSLVGGIVGSAIGGLFSHHKKSVDDSAKALNALTIAAANVTETLSNLPTGFKIAYDRYLAETPTQQGDSASGGGAGPSPGGGPIPGGPSSNVFNFHAPITVVANDPKSFMKQMQDTARANTNRGGPGLLLAGTRA